MRRISPLEQEYRELKYQDTPELWSRIEENLKEHSERSLTLQREEESRKDRRSWRNWSSVRRRTIFAAGMSAAAVFLLIMAGSPYFDLLSVGKKENMAGGSFGDLTESEYMADGNGAVVNDESLFCTEAGKNEIPNGNGWGEEERATSGVLIYSQLNLTDTQPLSIPPQAVCQAEDTMYFSEDILGDTELLCLGTVASVALEKGPSGAPEFLVYEILLDSVCYSDDYITNVTSVQAVSPIIKAVGEEEQSLYQLQEGSTYVLPLKRQEGRWKLLFPFAPQVRVAPGGGYLFHSGYASLTNDETFVVVGHQEGDNDFYYDRMLFRDDDYFLSDFIALVVDQTRNGGKL